MRLFSYHEKHEKKKAARLPLSAYLSYLLVATLMFTGVSFSKFATTASGSDSARVAYVVVAASGEEKSQKNVVDAAKDIPYEYCVKVSNIKDGKVSEVALAYTIYVDLPDGFPGEVNISISDTTTDPITTTGGAGVLKFVSSKTLPAGDEQHNEHIITISGTDDVSEGADNLELCIRIKAEQID